MKNHEIPENLRPGKTFRRIAWLLLTGALAILFLVIADRIRPRAQVETTAPSPIHDHDDASPVARITEWVSDPHLGSFAVIEILKPEKVAVDTLLHVRRGHEILGQLRVTTITTEGSLASPLDAFPQWKPESGDDLMVSPP